MSKFSTGLGNTLNLIPDSVRPMFAILVSLLTSTLFFLLSMELLFALTGIDFVHLQTILNDNTNRLFPIVLKSFLIIQSVSIFVLPPVIIAKVYKKRVFDFFTLNKTPDLFFIIASVVLVIVSSPFVAYLTEINEKLLDAILGAANTLKSQDEATQALVENLIYNTSFLSFFQNVLIIAFLPAFCEELFFRAFLQKRILNKYTNIHASILMSAFIFSFIHFQFYGFIPRFVLGIVFGYIFYWSGSLWTTILLHFTNNFMAVLSGFLISYKMLDKDIDKIGSGDTFYFGIISLVFMLAIIWAMYSKFNKSRSFR